MYASFWGSSESLYQSRNLYRNECFLWLLVLGQPSGSPGRAREGRGRACCIAPLGWCSAIGTDDHMTAGAGIYSKP